MSDFLTNLAARSIGAAPALRPRLTGLFEPHSPGAPLNQAELPIAEIGDSDAERGPAAPSAAALQPPSAPKPPGAAAPPDPGTPRAPLEPQPARTARAAPPADISAPGQQQPAATTTDPGATIGKFGVSSALEQTTRPTARVDADVATSGALAAPAPPRSTIPTRPARGPESTGQDRSASQNDLDVSTALLLDRPRTHDQPPREAAARVVADAIEARRSGTPVGGPQPAVRSEPVPTINVTIGRIEVRAVHQPAPARPPVAEPRAPLLSLDDYLKQREGERP